MVCLDGGRVDADDDSDDDDEDDEKDNDVSVKRMIYC